MKALTIRQPWAWAIIHGGKNVENRPWSPRCDAPDPHNRRTCGYTPGRIAIHAGWTPDTDAIDFVREQTSLDELPALARTFGAILGTVEVIDIHTANGCCHPWGQDDARYHWVLANPEPCTAIPMSGRLSLWTVPADVAAKLEAVTTP